MPRDARAHYVTALDRLGWAVTAGGALTGWLAVLLTIAGGERSLAVLALAWALGTCIAMAGIVAVAGPVWVLLHRRGWRGPGVAAVVAGLPALIVFSLAQLGATGGGYRLASAVVTSLPIALAAAAVGLVMQRVAYRRLL